MYVEVKFEGKKNLRAMFYLTNIKPRWIYVTFNIKYDKMIARVGLRVFSNFFDHS
jgi:hypothetical protein